MLTIETFTQFSRKLLNLGAQEASRLGHNIVESEHMLIAISKQKHSLVGKILSMFDISTEYIVEKVLEKREKGIVPSNVLSYSNDIKAIFEDSISIARSLSFDFVGVEHILLAILGKECMAKDILNNAGLHQSQALDEVIITKQNFDNIKAKFKNEEDLRLTRR